jgi:hypothetical protein
MQHSAIQTCCHRTTSLLAMILQASKMPGLAARHPRNFTGRSYLPPRM